MAKFSDAQLHVQRVPVEMPTEQRFARDGMFFEQRHVVMHVNRM